MATGGTPAPPVIPGAPTVIGQRGQPASTPGRPAQGRGGGGEKRYWNNASKRMETAAQIRNYKAPVNTRVSSATHAIAGTHPQGGTPAAKPAAATYPFAAGVLNPGGIFSEAERNEIGKNITGAENAERAATRIPYQQRGSEIVNTEGNVRNSLNQINTGSQTYLQGLIAGAEGSAKTANNYAAENALSAQKQVETAGQNAQTNIGGIMAANVAATQQRGEADVQSMRTLAAAAAAQGAQGLNTAQARFATEASRNKAAEAQALEKVAGKARNERMEIPIKLLAGKTAREAAERKGLIETRRLANAERGTNIKAGQLGLNARSVANKRQGEVEKNETGRRNARTNEGKLAVSIDKLGIERFKGESDATYKKHVNEIGFMNAEDRRWYNERQAEYKRYQMTHPKTTQSVATARKYMSEIGTAESLARGYLAKETNNPQAGALNPKIAGKVRQALQENQAGKKPISAQLISAAMNLIAYGRLGPNDQKVAIGYGITPSMNPNWFRSH